MDCISLGDALRNDGKYEQAVQAYSLAIEQNPSDELLYMLRSLAYSKLGDPRAVEDLAKMNELSPERYQKFANIIMSENPSEKVYFEQGKDFHRAEQYEQAIKSYSEAIDINPHKADYFILRGDGYSKLNEPERAIEDYTKAIGLDPKDATAYSLRADVYLKTKDTYKAIEDWKTAARLGDERARVILRAKGIQW